MTRILYAASTALLLSLCLGCNDKSRMNTDAKQEALASNSSMVADSSAVATDNEDQQPQANKDGQKPAAGKPTGAAADNPDWDKKIIKTADLTLEVNNFGVFTRRLHQAVRQSGGYIAQEDQNQSLSEITNTLTLKVPVAMFDDLLMQLPSDSERLVSKKISSQDVTMEMVDTKSRLETKKQVRDRYLEVLHQAHKTEDIVTAQKEIDDIQQEMDQALGRIAYLGHSAAYSTINIKFYQILNPGAPKDTSPSFVQRLKDALADGWQGLSDFVIGGLHVWPMLLLIGFIAWWIRKTIRSVKAIKEPTEQPKAEPAS